MSQIISFNSLRFFAALFVILVHIGNNLKVEYPFRCSYLAVEVFFILSGFLLAKTYEKLISSHPFPEPLSLCKTYFCRRFVRLWPEYIFATFVFLLISTFVPIKVEKYSLFLSTFLLSDFGGIKTILADGWYVPVVFWCSCLLFNLLVFGKDKTKTVILPIIALLCLFCLFNNAHHFNGVKKVLSFGFITKGTVRGLLGLIVGIYTFFVCNGLKKHKLSLRPKIVTPLLFVLEVIAVSGILYIFIFSKKYDIGLFNIYFYTSFLIGLLFFQKEISLKFLSWKIWDPFAKISYTLYLTHRIVLEITKIYYISWVKENLVLGTLLIVLSALALAFFCYHTQKYLFSALKRYCFDQNKNA